MKFLWIMVGVSTYGKFSLIFLLGICFLQFANAQVNVSIESVFGVELDHYYKFKYNLSDGNQYTEQKTNILRTKFYGIAPSIFFQFNPKHKIRTGLTARLQKETVEIADKLVLPNSLNAQDLVLHNFMLIPILTADYQIWNKILLDIGLGYPYSFNKEIRSAAAEFEVTSEALPHFYQNEVIFTIGISYRFRNFYIGLSYENFGDSKFYLPVPPLYLRGDEIHKKRRVGFTLGYSLLK